MYPTICLHYLIEVVAQEIELMKISLNSIQHKSTKQKMMNMMIICTQTVMIVQHFVKKFMSIKNSSENLNLG